MELLERLLGDDDEASESDGDDDDDMLFDEDGDDLDGFGDDGFDDGLGFDEDGDDGGAATAELEGRIDEMENEVASLSSTVGTIRSENEEISNTVNDVEENVRKLLDIYEMVTRGVNPFVDDAQAGGGFDGDGDSLGLFDDNGNDEEEEDLDDDIAGADAEEFFDDDFLDEDETDDFDDDFGQPIDDAATTEDTMADDSDDSDDSGKSFDELKDEYESGDADWADGEEPSDDGGDTLADDVAAEPTNGDGWGNEGGDALVDDVAAEPTNGDSEGAFDGFDETDGDDGNDGNDGDDGVSGEAVPDPDPDPDPDPNQEPEPTAANDPPVGETGAQAVGQAAEASNTDGGDLQFAANTLMNDSETAVTKPYLDGLPSGYVSDLLVMEWLEYLVEESDVTDAARAVEYYRRIRWVGEDAADDLHEFLLGFGDIEDDVTGPPSDLSIDHHVASLRYISRLTGSTADSVVFECWSGGGGVPFGL